MNPHLADGQPSDIAFHVIVRKSSDFTKQSETQLRQSKWRGISSRKVKGFPMLNAIKQQATSHKPQARSLAPQIAVDGTQQAVTEPAEGQKLQEREPRCTLTTDVEEKNASATWELEHVESYNFHIRNQRTGTYLQRRQVAQPASLVLDSLPDDAKAAQWIFREAH